MLLILNTVEADGHQLKGVHDPQSRTGFNRSSRPAMFSIKDQQERIKEEVIRYLS